MLTSIHYFFYNTVKFRDKKHPENRMSIGPCFIINSRGICHPYRRVPRQIRNDKVLTLMKNDQKGGINDINKVIYLPSHVVSAPRKGN